MGGRGLLTINSEMKNTDDTGKRLQQKRFYVGMSDNKLRALTWREPFATLMLCGKIETRSWTTNVRGKVLICAAAKKNISKNIMEICGSTQIKRMVATTMQHQAITNPGHAIAVGELVDSRPMRKDDEDSCFVMHRNGLYCHIYKNVRPIKPFPWRGKQGWSIVPEGIESQIEYLD